MTAPRTEAGRRAVAANRDRIKRQTGAMFFSGPRLCRHCQSYQSREGGRYMAYGKRKCEWLCGKCAESVSKEAA